MYRIKYTNNTELIVKILNITLKKIFFNGIILCS